MPRVLVTLCTYNERDNIARLSPRFAARCPTRTCSSSMTIRPTAPGARRRVGGGRRARSRAASGRQAGARLGHAGRLSGRHRARLRFRAQYGCRLQPRSRIPSRPGRLHAAGRRRHRLALRSGRRHRRLGHRSALHEPGNQLVRATLVGAFDARQQRRLSLLSLREAQRDRSRSGAVPRLLLPGRDPVSLPPGRLPLRGDADRVSRPALRHVEDQLARVGDCAVDHSAARNRGAAGPRW